MLDKKTLAFDGAYYLIAAPSTKIVATVEWRDAPAVLDAIVQAELLLASLRQP